MDKTAINTPIFNEHPFKTNLNYISTPVKGNFIIIWGKPSKP
jgi:hypothetical protein